MFHFLFYSPLPIFTFAEMHSLYSVPVDYKLTYNIGIPELCQHTGMIVYMSIEIHTMHSAGTHAHAWYMVMKILIVYTSHL
jgi:hypothetical protein